ncbi:MAG: class II aldolase/adducin family protein [Burkholderiales bacterium]|nr:class II aldolase/adducin family protein [Burkholderiales bacterium]
MSSACAALIDDLVSANHILFVEGVVDGFGHVSVRHDRRDDHFLLACGVAPATVTAEDIVEVDYDGVVHDDAGRRSYLERYIHSEIYKARPDVMAVVHSHSPAIIPFGVTRATLRPVCHMSGFLGLSTPVFEIRDTAGEDNDMLVKNAALGKALAASLGPHQFALMRGHGSVTVAHSLKLAVARAIWAEMNARLQSEAMRVAALAGHAGDADGGVRYLTAGEAKGSMAINETVVDRPWDFWKSRAKAALAGMTRI